MPTGKQVVQLDAYWEASGYQLVPAGSLPGLIFPGTDQFANKWFQLEAE